MKIGLLIHELLHGNEMVCSAEMSNCGEQVAAVLVMNLIGIQWQ